MYVTVYLTLYTVNGLLSDPLHYDGPGARRFRSRRWLLRQRRLSGYAFGLALPRRQRTMERLSRRSARSWLTFVLTT